MHEVAYHLRVVLHRKVCGEEHIVEGDTGQRIACAFKAVKGYARGVGQRIDLVDERFRLVLHRFGNLIPRQILRVRPLSGQLDDTALELAAEILHVAEKHKDGEEMVIDAVGIIGQKFFKADTQCLNLLAVRFRSVAVDDRQFSEPVLEGLHQLPSFLAFPLIDHIGGDRHKARRFRVVNLSAYILARHCHKVSRRVEERIQLIPAERRPQRAFQTG